MPLRLFKSASGLRIRAGEKGLVYHHLGSIIFNKAPVKGIDSNLWGAMKLVVDDLRLTVVASSIDTGTHATHSRHYWGGAVDLVEVYPTGQAPLAASLNNPHALKLVDYLTAQGWKAYEQGPWPAVLLGPVHSPHNQTPVPHENHIHGSIFRA